MGKSSRVSGWEVLVGLKVRVILISASYLKEEDSSETRMLEIKNPEEIYLLIMTRLSVEGRRVDD